MSIYVANWDLGSGGYWGSGLKLTAGIWDISLCSQHIISVTAIFHAGIKPTFFFPPLPFSLLFFPLVPSDLQTDCMTERVPQGGELPLIQIFCEWFVLVFVSLLAPNWTLLPLTKAAIIPPILFYVSRLSLPAGGSVRNRQPLGYNAGSLMLPGRPSKTRINFRPLSFTSLSELKVVRWAKWTNKYCEDYNELYSPPAT